MIISKILYHEGIIKVLAALNDSQSNLSGEYFNFGYPTMEPCTLRGNGLVILNNRFYEDNIDCIEYGSIVDIGGVEFGHIDSSILRNNVGRLKLSPDIFYQIGNHCFSNGVLSKERFNSCTLIKVEYGDEIFHEIQSMKNHHARFFEFKVTNNAVLKEDHIERLAAPYGYRKNKHEKVIFYNSKYGIEYALNGISR